MTAQHLIASDKQIASLTYTARTRSDGTHHALGSNIADALDALVAYAWDEQMSASAALLDAATAIHTARLEREEITDPTDDAYGEWKETA